MDLKISRNRLGVINNTFQGDALKVLTVCSAGCLRSPTAATLLGSEPWNFNTRSCGLTEEFAIVPISAALVLWADVILVMESWMGQDVETIFNGAKAANNTNKDLKLICLNIPDDFGFMQEELQVLMQSRFKEIFKISDLN